MADGQICRACGAQLGNKHVRADAYANDEWSKEKALTLLWINWQRVKRGHRPLLRIRNGKPRSSSMCPVARSLCSKRSVRVGGNHWVDSKGYQHPLPRFVRRFVHEYDRDDASVIGSIFVS